eukprot:augustus_masked-scaffold_15-processed-gene-10.66-mRNA-1 protein AED:0.35 eAED:0.57 QI:0/-1/0/1/-1/1/1/0/1160
MADEQQVTVAVEGLENDIETQVDAAAPTGEAEIKYAGTPPTKMKDLPFIPYKAMGFSKKMMSITSEIVIPFSAEKCFSVCLDYLNFLSAYMVDTEKDAWSHGMKEFKSCPQWEREVPCALTRNGPGSAFRYSFFDDGYVFSMVEEIKVVDDTGVDADGNKVYKFGVHFSNELTKPMHPAKNHSWQITFTTYRNDPNKCHLFWERKMRKPRVLGVSIAETVKTRFVARLQRHAQIFWDLAHRKFSTRIPQHNSKVLVVGAGPSGLHMAHLLISKGLPVENITILEKTDRYGGKTLSIEDKTNCQLKNPKFTKDGKLITGDKTTEELYEGGAPVYHELGTCYLSPGYFAVRKLLKDLQEKSPVGSVDITKEVGPDTYAIEGSVAKPGEALTMEEWIYKEGKDKTCIDNVLCCTTGTRHAGVNAAVLIAKLKYCKLHEELLGNFYFTLPPRPKEKDLDELLLPFGEFLRKHKLDILAPLFTYAQTAQGYGLIDEVPTYWGMSWLTPDLLDGYFEWHQFFEGKKNEDGTYKKSMKKYEKHMRETGRELSTLDNPRKGMLVSSWLSLWDRIVELDGLDKRIKFNCDILNITRKGVEDKTEVTVNYNYNGSTLTEKYDFLVVAAPMSDAYEDSTKQTLPMELFPHEETLFLNKDIVAGKFRTSLFKPSQNGNFEKDHLRIFIDSILKSDKSEVVPGTGDVFGMRDSYKAVQPMLSTVPGDETDPMRESPREKMFYQYASPNAKITEEEFMKKSDEYLKSHPDLGPPEDMKMLKAQAWTYFTHYEGDALRNGLLWDVTDIQGQNSTFFVHASTNFESVLDIVNYNNMIFEGASGGLNTAVKPESDARPEEYQRPQQFLLNVNNSTIRTAIRFLMNGLILILWTIFYVISYPLAEGFYLRLGRYQLQKAFKTPGLGWRISYNMKKFLADSPTVRGYVDYHKGLSNGLPEAPIPEDYDPNIPVEGRYGDNVFKIIMEPKHKFAEKYKNVPVYPEVQYSMQWNLTDFRTGVRFWLTTFKDGFMPIMGPTVQAGLAFIAYYMPNYYSFFFSWIFATQFRLLIGYSYRFEDAKGGGLYIPECHMLKVGIKEYGEEAGRRVCLTVCKIFTEEVMLKKRMKVDFQPDFIFDKPGFGCEVRLTQFKEHAFSDHSLFESQTEADHQKTKEHYAFDW